MIRFYRIGAATRTAESRRTAQQLTRHGWRRCTATQHRALWRLRDMRTLRDMRMAVRARERAVGGVVGAAPGLTGGWKVYRTDRSE
jgi:hypothetical protein